MASGWVWGVMICLHVVEVSTDFVASTSSRSHRADQRMLSPGNNPRLGMDEKICRNVSWQIPVTPRFWGPVAFSGDEQSFCGGAALPQRAVGRFRLYADQVDFRVFVEP